MYIRGQGKIEYLTGEKKAPVKTDPSFATWDAENSMVMTWLVNSMTEEICSNYICYSTAKDLWDNVNQIYSNLDNQSRVLELNLKLGDIREGGDTITQYFHKLTRIWQDLDLFDSYDWESTKDQAHYTVVEDSRVYKFLTGLNDEFDEVRSRVTSKMPLPSINETFSEVRKEESRQSVMLGKKSTDSIETSTMMIEATANKASTPPKQTTSMV